MFNVKKLSSGTKKQTNRMRGHSNFLHHRIPFISKLGIVENDGNPNINLKQKWNCKVTKTI